MEQCIQPGVVTDDNLVAYAYGEADQLTAEHIRACPACAAAAGEYARFDRRLGHLFHRIDCPSAETLVLAERRRLPAIEQLRVAAHLRTCSRCAAEAEAIREPPAADPLPSIGLGERLRRVVAVLTTPPQLAVAGLRGTTGPSAQTYRAEDLTITIHLEATARRGHVNLTGEIWQEGAGAAALAGQTVRLLAPDGGAATATIGDLGDFIIDAVATGIYRLEVELADRVVVVEDLRVDS